MRLCLHVAARQHREQRTDTTGLRNFCLCASIFACQLRDGRSGLNLCLDVAPVEQVEQRRDCAELGALLLDLPVILAQLGCRTCGVDLRLLLGALQQHKHEWQAARGNDHVLVLRVVRNEVG